MTKVPQTLLVRPLAWAVHPSSATPVLGNAGFVTWLFNTTDLAEGVTYSSGTGRVTIPTGGAGWYLIGAAVKTATQNVDAGDDAQVDIVVNAGGSPVRYFLWGDDTDDANSAKTNYIQNARLIHLNDGDTVELQGYILDSATSSDGTANNATWWGLRQFI